MERWFKQHQARLGFPDDIAASDADVAQALLIEDLRGQVESLTSEVAELGKIVRHRYLTDEGCISQLYTSTRELHAKMDGIAGQLVAPVALAVGVALRDAGFVRPEPAAEAEPARAVGEVLAMPQPRRRKKTG